MISEALARISVDITGEPTNCLTPLMNAVLYGVDTRAHKEIEYLNKKIGINKIFEFNGNALSSQQIGPKILWLKNNKPEIFEKTHKIINVR